MNAVQHIGGRAGNFNVRKVESTLYGSVPNVIVYLLVRMSSRKRKYESVQETPASWSVILGDKASIKAGYRNSDVLRGAAIERICLTCGASMIFFIRYFPLSLK